jgi:hypothetical protein
LAFGSEESEKALVIDVEPKCLGGCIEICTVDEEREALIGIKMHFSTL